MTDLKILPLAVLHAELGAKTAGFAGYDMPLQYPLGVMGEHNHTRSAAGLFDVSHMGQILLKPKQGMEAVGAALERLMPVDVLGLQAGRQRYGLLTNDAGGILDDLMFANREDDWLLVVNAACKDADLAHLTKHLAPVAEVEAIADRALLALQGPTAEEALSAVVDVSELRFMDSVQRDSDFGELWISRSGYTGEDGFEVSVAAHMAEGFARALLGHDTVQPIGLGARDSLRLEAGLCLYGQDMDTTLTPVEAGLRWAIGKARKPGGDRAGGYLGDAVIGPQLQNGAAKRLVGLHPGTRAPMRSGTALFDGAQQVGKVTSGGFGPTFGGPVAMGYVPTELASPGTDLTGDVRGKHLPVTVCALPFAPHNYKR